eukprot:m.252366 g.252366  ORF g.252366 m.252366 type:complete len:293 (-) comp19123_c0_seq1:327-1205(-)
MPTANAFAALVMLGDEHDEIAKASASAMSATPPTTPASSASSTLVAATAEADEREAEREAWNTFRWIPRHMAKEFGGRRFADKGQGKNKGKKTKSKGKSPATAATAATAAAPTPKVYECHAGQCKASGRSRTFASLVDIVDHLVYDEGLVMQACNQCGDLVWEPRMGDHVRADHHRAAERCFQCRVWAAHPHRRHCHCGTPARGRNDLEEHERVAGCSPNHVCFTCGNGFVSKEALFAHKTKLGHVDERRPHLSSSPRSSRSSSTTASAASSPIATPQHARREPRTPFRPAR